MEIQSTGVQTQGDQVVSDGGDALSNLDLSDFLKLFIAELQNQDPLDPMDNSEMLAQISQIREIGATDNLTNTLDAVRLGQSLSTAGGLIGRHIRALTSDGPGDQQEFIEGTVEKVVIDNGEPVLHVNGEPIRLENISEILPAND